jgi:rod shape-determining protein MreC
VKRQLKYIFMLEKRKNNLYRLYLIAVVILLIFLGAIGVLTKAEKYFLSSYGYVQNKTYVFILKLKSSFINYSEAQNLKSENEKLNEEVSRLNYDVSQLQAYKIENEKLRAALNFKEEKGYDLITTNVIGRDTNQANTLVINKGTKDGIEIGYAAIVDNGIIIGKIIDVKDYLATILLLPDKQSQLIVSTESSNKSIGLAEGEYGLSIKINLISQDLDIKEGDIIISSGTENFIPRGLIIGKINRVISQENELFKSATLKPLADYNDISIVSIIIPKR